MPEMNDVATSQFLIIINNVSQPLSTTKLDRSKFSDSVYCQLSPSADTQITQCLKVPQWNG